MKDWKTIACLIFLLIFPFGFIIPQTEQYKFRHLTTEDGLPSNYTWSIMQDSKGFMWFTTRAGLCRYDGYNVKVFQYDPDDSSSISDLYVKSTISEDSNGFIWVGTFNGLNKFDPISEKFTRYYFSPDDPKSVSSPRIRYTYVDREGVVWIGTEAYGLSRYNETTDDFDSFLPSPVRSLSNYVTGIYEDNSGIFWIGTRNGLYQFDRETIKFTLIEQLYDKEKKISNRFTTITEDNNGNIWYCADQIYMYNKSSKKLTPVSELSWKMNLTLNPAYMNILLDEVDSEKILWIARGKLFKYNLSSQKFTTILNNPTIPDKFIGHDPRALFRDPSGMLWIATTSGITIADPGSAQIRSHPEFYSEYQLDALAFLKDSKGHLWIGGSKRLIHLDENEQLIHLYKTSEAKDKNSFKGSVRKIFEDSDNKIWIGCMRDGVYFLDQETNEFIKCKLIGYKKDFRPDNMYDIFEDSQGTIWIGTEGLYKQKKDSPKPTFFHLDTSNYFTKHTTLSKIQEDHSGNLWISSIRGAVLRQPATYRGTNTFFEYTHDPNDPTSLSNSHIWTVYVDDRGEVWIGTNHGLNRYVPEKDCFERYLTDLESGGSFIYGIVRDKNGYLWMDTEGGLIGFDPSDHNNVSNSSGKVKQYLAFDDIFTNELYKDDSEKIYIGSARGSGNGYFSFFPDDIKENKFIPRIVLTSFKIRNEAINLDSSISIKKHVILNYNQNFFSFEFAALDYTNPEENQYAYRLEGLDEKWIYSENRRTVNYTNVSPGKYIFRVKGSNSDGYWNESGTSISITILPPPWKTWWAYLIYILIVFSIIYFIARFYLRRQRLLHKLEVEQIQTEKLEELDKLKSRFFANISHEFRTPLTLILGPIEKLRSYIKDKESIKDLDMMKRNTHRLQQLINQLLNLSQIESGKMKLHASRVNIIKLVNGYVQSFESLAKQKNIDLLFKAEEENIQLFVDKDKIEKILYNLLSNAFKFTGEGGRIEIEMAVSNWPLAFSKEDEDQSDNTRLSVLADSQLKANDPASPAGRQKPKATFGQWIEIKISDTGSGIPPEKLPHIFDRFYQADDTYTKDQEGTGIGLALTKELVKLHHGEIQVESQISKGTTFIVYLPVGKEHLKSDEIFVEELGEEDNEFTPDFYPELEQSDEKVIADQPFDKSKPILLLVEDNRDLREYIRSSLGKSYNILEAVDGEDGLSEAIKHIPDLILSDVMMPKMNGIELCSKLKTDERSSHIPVILLTARASSESKIEGLETGADDYISKPFDPTELQIRIKNLIKQRQKLREKFAKDFGKENNIPAIQSITSGLNQIDQKFLQKALDIVNQHLSDTDFNIEEFGKEMAMSRQQMHRKFRALMDQSATEFIRTIRLKKAAELLSQKSGTVSEIAYDVGFNTLSYFTKSFQEYFGVLPSEYGETRAK